MLHIYSIYMTYIQKNKKIFQKNKKIFSKSLDKMDKVWYNIREEKER